MANKYTEELFGAIDEIVKRRLRDMEKDNTILCYIEDATNAEKGEYIVSTNALRFTAYSQITTYAVGQNVWVLIPEGNYENTKIILGRYVSKDSEAFNYVDPFNSFLDMTNNIASDYTNIELGLIANEEYESTGMGTVTRKYFSKENNETGSILRSGFNVNILQKLSRVGIQATFRTDFDEAKELYAGNYGVHVSLITDKDIQLDFELDVVDMTGTPYNLKGGWIQKKVYDFDPEEQGNVKDILCYFYQNNNFFGADGPYPIYYENDIPMPNIFVDGLEIQMGYSTDDISGTTAFLWTNDELYYDTSTGNSDDCKKTMYPRLAYEGVDGYTFVNDLDSFKKFNRIINGISEDSSALGEYPKLKLYYQDYYKKSNISGPYRDNRAGIYWHEIDDWDEQNFQLVRILTNKSQAFKVIFCFENSASYDLGAMQNIRGIQTVLSNEYNNFDSFTNDEIKAIHLFALPPYKYTISEVFDPTVADGNPGYAHLLDGLDPTGKWIDENWKPEGQWNTTIPDITSKVIWAFIGALCEDRIKNNNRAGILNFFIANQNGLKYKYTTSEPNDDWKSFDLLKSKFEILYKSENLNFINLADEENELAELIQDLVLTATDEQGGVYNIYKATEGSTSELIKPSDESLKRSIEASFTTYSLEDSGLDAASRVYWLIPKNNTMIKTPADGINFGAPHYDLVKYTEDEFNAWCSNEGPGKLYKLVTTSTSTKYEEVAYTDDWNGGKYYIRSEEKLIVAKGTTETLPEVNDNEDILYYKDGKFYYGDDTELEDYVFSQIEQTLIEARIGDYWIIMEDRINRDPNKPTIFTEKASLTYQIKKSYKRSLTNNRIYGAVYKTGQLYTASIDLIFGTKNLDGLEYTLSIVPIEEEIEGVTEEEKQQIEKIPSAWTMLPNSGKTNSLELKASVFDAKNKDVSEEFTFEFNWLDNAHRGNGLMFGATSGRNIIIQTSNYSSQYYGAIIKCTARKSTDITIDQYYILPVRTSREFYSLDGPDTIVYDANGVNPEYYNIAYSLVKSDGTEISDIDVTIENVSTADQEYIPSISEKKLIPTIGYTNEVKYDFYVKIKVHNTTDNQDYYWYQPILIIKGKNENTSISSIKNDIAEVKDASEKKTISSIMSVGKKDENDKLTGIVIGSLPKENNAERSGILGYLKDTEVFGLLDNGSMFIGQNKGITIDTATGNATIDASKCTINNLNVSISQINNGTLPITQGGTGKTTAADAWAALGGKDSGKHEDGYYALAGHNHDTVYAAINHNHSGIYATVNHTHSNYSTIDHTHTASNITNFESAVKSIIDNDYSALDGSNVVLNTITINGTTYNVGVTSFLGQTVLTLN